MLKKGIVAQTLAVVLVLGPSALWAQLNMTDASQQVGGEIGYKDADGIDHIDYSDWDPDHGPAGPGSVSLSAFASGYGVKLGQILNSSFGTNQFLFEGDASASAEWGTQPSGARDVHGGGGFLFDVIVDRGSTPTALDVSGQIDISMSGDAVNSGETLVDVSLRSGDGSEEILIWREAVDGTGGDTSRAISHVVWLRPLTTYRIDVSGVAATMANPTYPGLKGGKAAIFLDVRGTEGDPMLAVPAKDPIAPNAKSVTFHVVRPPGVSGFDETSFMLEGITPASRVRENLRKGYTLAKFPTSGLDLWAHVGHIVTLRLTATGLAIGDPQIKRPFFADTSFLVEKKGGGKPY